jgi:hypothetical protein
MAEWIPTEQFNQTEYGRLNQQPGANNFQMTFAPSDVPPGGRVVADPKDGRFGIIVDAEGIAVSKVVLKP